jgi:hypothetical protein
MSRAWVIFYDKNFPLFLLPGGDRLPSVLKHYASA